MLTGCHPGLASARGWLDWSQGDLAKRSNVSLGTIRNFEKGRTVPIRNNLDAICAALEGAGVCFTYAEGGTPTGMTVNGARRPVPQPASSRSAG